MPSVHQIGHHMRIDPTDIDGFTQAGRADPCLRQLAAEAGAIMTTPTA